MDVESVVYECHATKIYVVYKGDDHIDSDEQA
jgi:hypothetical protein